MIFASLGLDWANFQRGINGAMASTRQLGGAMQQSMAGGVAAGILQAGAQLLSLQAVMKAVTFAADGLRDALQLGDDLVDLNAQTGVAIDKLMELQLAFDLNGMKAEQLQPVIAKLQRSIADAASGSDEAALKFARMGISIADIQGLTADEQLQRVGAAISAIQNPAARSAAAMDIFGKSGAKLLSVFAAGGMDEVRAILGTQSAMLLENAGVFGRASDILGLAGNKVRGFFVGIASEIVPQLMEVIDASAKLDFSGVGREIGSAFGTALVIAEQIYDAITSAGAMMLKAFDLAARIILAPALLLGKLLGGERGPSGQQEGAPETVDNFFTKARAEAERRTQEAREKYKTPEAAPTGVDIASKGVMSAAAPVITTSMAKVGALGGAVWGGDQGINVQRDQLAVQQRIADSIDRFLQAAQPMQNPYLGSVTPQLGVI
jgi:hypothetical protein